MEILEFPLGSPKTKCHLGAGNVAMHRVHYKGEGGGFPQVRAMGPKILILKSIGGQIIFNFHWLLKDEKATNWNGGFSSFHWTNKTSSRRGHGRLIKCVNGVCVFFFSQGNKGGEGVCEKEH